MATAERIGTRQDDGSIVMEPFTDQRMTTAIPWSSPEATPVSDIANVARVGATRYGIQYLTLEIHPADLHHIAKTKEFAGRASFDGPYGPAVSADELKTLSERRIAEILSAHTDLRVVLNYQTTKGTARMLAAPDSHNIIESAILRF